MTALVEQNVTHDDYMICIRYGETELVLHAVYYKYILTWRWGSLGLWSNPPSRGRKIACFRRSDSGVRAKHIANENAGKNEGKLPSLLSFFPAFSLAIFFARAPLSERLEQAIEK